MNGSSLTIHPPTPTDDSLTTFRTLLENAPSQPYIALLERDILAFAQYSGALNQPMYWLLRQTAQQLMTPGRNRFIVSRHGERAANCIDYTIALELQHLEFSRGLFQRCAGPRKTWEEALPKLYLSEARIANSRIALLDEEVASSALGANKND